MNKLNRMEQAAQDLSERGASASIEAGIAGRRVRVKAKRQDGRYMFRFHMEYELDKQPISRRDMVRALEQEVSIADLVG